MKNIIILICTCIALSGCTSTPKTDSDAGAQAIRNLEDQWSVALREKDVDKIISFYAADGVNMSPGRSIARGPEAIKERLVSMFADTSLLFEDYTGSIEKVEVSASGDLGYAYGQDELTVKSKVGNVKDKSKWVDIWKKIDGEWKVIVSSGNSNQPLQEN